MTLDADVERRLQEIDKMPYSRKREDSLIDLFLGMLTKTENSLRKGLSEK